VWIVQLALRRPYTFVVLAMLIVLMGVVEILRMPTDIYPQINIPVVAAVWTYNGLPPGEMEGRITTQFERATTTTVSGIDHIESQTLFGVSAIKIFLQPGTSTEAAVAQIVAAANPIMKSLPPGSTPPLIIPYSASNVPILQLALSSTTLDEQQIYDIGTNFLRPGLATVQGAQFPLPIGGKQREIVVDIDTQKLFAWGISPSEVSTALNSQNLVVPSGTVKIGAHEYPILVNASPPAVAGFNDLPIKMVDGATVYLRDVAHVRDGYAPQTNMVVTDGVKGGLLPVLKSHGASTLDVVSRVRRSVPAVQATLPQGFDVKQLFDQSVFVRGAIDGVLREAAIAAGLTGLMMLLFLGSWRSTVIVLISIPLALLVSVIVLGLLGQTLNLMTLGGLSLAVGILVDDATVEVENFQRQRALGKPLTQAILDGAREIATPAFVSTLCICIVFVPVVFVAGAASSLWPWCSRCSPRTSCRERWCRRWNSTSSGASARTEPAADRSRACTRSWRAASSGSEWLTRTRCRGSSTGREGSSQGSASRASARSRSFRSSDRTSFRMSTRASYACTSGRSQGLESRRPRGSSRKSRITFVVSCRRPSSTP